MAQVIIATPLPFILTPNTLADADQVMADLNYIASQVNANTPTAGTVKATANSTLLGYLQQVLSAGPGITLTLLNPGAAEQIEVASDAATVQLAVIQANALCI